MRKRTTMKAFTILDPGVLTTFQDLGREGFRKYGIPPSGAMDRFALRVANLLLQNPETAIGLEITLQGLRMIALAPMLIAVTGADLTFTINGRYLPPWRSLFVKTGDEIDFKRRKSGLRAYLTVRGGFVGPCFFGSGSVFQRGEMGSPLQRDDVLVVSEIAQESCLEEKDWSEKVVRGDTHRESIRVIMGPQAEYFTHEGIKIFLNSEYKIRAQSDRMALRLEGPNITHAGQADIISEPVMPGSIQVPKDGCPIILMADAQVTGGYAKIANVIRADMRVLAQKIPGERIHFEAVELEAAHRAMEEEEILLSQFHKSSTSAAPDPM